MKSEDEDAADQDEGKGLTRRDWKGKEYKDEENKGEDGRRRKKKNHNNKNKNHYNNNENIERVFHEGMYCCKWWLKTGEGITE